MNLIWGAIILIGAELAIRYIYRKILGSTPPELQEDLSGDFKGDWKFISWCWRIGAYLIAIGVALSGIRVSCIIIVAGFFFAFIGNFGAACLFQDPYY